MKNSLKILILTLILISCKKETEKKTEVLKPEFNLKMDYSNFKQKMTELDTLNIFIEHSVCVSSAQEKIEITKKGDSLKIKSEYYSTTFQKEPNWEIIYQKKIFEKDTVWDFDNFLVKNKNRMSSENRKNGRIQIRNKKDTIHLFTNGLNDLWSFMDDYGKTANKLCPDYLSKINLIVEIVEGVNEDEIKETELEME